jgi:hypothetical protein
MVTAVIIRPAARESHRAVFVCFTWYMGGLLIFFAMANWTVRGWTESYWIWTMAKDFWYTLTVYCLVGFIQKLIKDHDLKIKFPINAIDLLPILFFTVIRTIWEIIAQVFNKDINNSMVLDYMFYVLLSIVILNLLNQLRKEWNQKP